MGLDSPATYTHAESQRAPFPEGDSSEMVSNDFLLIQGRCQR